MVITRIAPSPTGRLHIGTTRAALFNYLYARHTGGKFLIRCEDTDHARSKKEYEEEIMEGLSWLGLSHDGYTRQSENVGRHRALLEKIIAEGKAYLSHEESQSEAGKMIDVVRLKNPGRRVEFHDEVRGDLAFDTTELGDFVIARAIDDPLYHFAAVVDDMDAGITHVIRGEDHISNTPRQILIQEALGASRPIYAHLPLILGTDRSKLSKRNGATSLMDYRDEGFIPEGIVNYLALLGWNPGGEREDYSMSELIELFTLADIQKGGAVFDRTKLLSVNQRWMRKLSDEEYVRRGDFAVTDSALLRKLVPLLKERAHTYNEARALLADGGELAGLFTTPKQEAVRLTEKELPDTTGSTSVHLACAKEIIEALPETPSIEETKTALMAYADTNPKEKGGRGAVLWPLRYALSGAERSPDPFTLVFILGKEESASRIRTAIAILEG